MSKTFSTSSSYSTRARGANRGAVRGTGARQTVPGRGAAVSVSGPGLSAGFPPRPAASTTSRGAAGPGNRLGASVRTQPTLSNAKSQGFGAATRSGGGLSGRGGMDNSRLGGHNGAGERTQGQSSDLEGRAQYAGGYTVFSPNEKRRRQVEEMARRETQAYEQHKQANSVKSYSYVGTVGGGDTTQNQVRARQANEVWAQKYNRQMRQQQQRQVAKQAEEQSIQERKDQARRKAEQNAMRNSQAPSVEEVRRNRESFLARFDSNRTQQASNEAGSSSTSGETSAGRARISQPVLSPPRPTSTRQHQNTGGNRKSSGNRNNSSNVVGETSPIAVSSRQNNPPGALSTRVGAAQAKSPAAAYQGRQVKVEADPTPPASLSLSHSYTSDLGSRAKVEPEEVKQEDDRLNLTPQEGAIGSYNGLNPQQEEEIAILFSMYPDIAPEELKELLIEMGSLDKVIEVLDFQE